MAWILVIDDDEDFAQAVATVLRGNGHEVELEHDAERVIGRLEERRPDAIILDVMFPENPSAGFEIARAIRRKFDPIPTIMLTAVNQQFPLGFSNKDIDPVWLPVTEFVEKPVDFAVLGEKVAALLA
jgi:DNA-binding response OmpR family regulator